MAGWESKLPVLRVISRLAGCGADRADIASGCLCQPIQSCDGRGELRPSRNLHLPASDESISGATDPRPCMVSIVLPDPPAAAAILGAMGAHDVFVALAVILAIAATHLLDQHSHA